MESGRWWGLRVGGKEVHEAEDLRHPHVELHAAARGRLAAARGRLPLHDKTSQLWVARNRGLLPFPRRPVSTAAQLSNFSSVPLYQILDGNSGAIWEPAERPRSWKRRHLRRDDFYLDSSSFTLSSYTGVQLQLNAFSVLKSRGDLFYNTKFSMALLFGWI